ncbi:hypothetical protein LEMLEM_LOCUS16382, partial [Lemmus lemmus]
MKYDLKLSLFVIIGALETLLNIQDKERLVPSSYFHSSR